jgi:hypothetical protein
MAWQEVGTVSLDGAAFAVDVGTVPLPATGGLEIRVQQLTPADEAPYRAGLMYIRTASGRTLGTRKFWGHPEGEDYALGTLLSAEESSGVLVVEPRYLNLKALKAGRIWQLQFWARPAPDSGGGGGGAAISGSFVTAGGTGLELARVVFP